MKKIFLLTFGIFLSLSLAVYAQDNPEREPRTIETNNGVENIALPTDTRNEQEEESVTEEVLGVEKDGELVAQDEETPQPRTIETENGTENIAVPTNEDAEVTTQNEQPEPELIAVEDQVFIIYTHEDCPHCAEVEEFVRLNSIEDRIDYRQLKNNEDSMAQLEDIWEQFEVSPEEEGWPFMVYTTAEGEDYAVGDAPIIDVLTDELGIEDPITEDEGDNDSSSNSFLLVIGGLFFVAIVGYGVYQFLFNKNE